MTPNLKRTIACVIDTECCYKNAKQFDKPNGLVYHFGCVIGNLDQDHSFYVREMDYYVQEVMQDIENFFFKNKEGFKYGVNQNMALAWKDSIKNPHKVKKWKHIVEELNENINSMGVEYITSYNFNFDIGTGDKVGAIRKTHQQLTDKTFYLPRGVETFCLMDIVATLMANRNFNSWVKLLSEDDLKQMTTEKGNLSYSAECMLRYLSKDLFYSEQHTALRDSRLEFRLLMECWKRYSKIIKSDFVNNIKSVSWREFNSGIPSTKKLANRKERGTKKGVSGKTKRGKI